jgi:hypothetical protein
VTTLEILRETFGPVGAASAAAWAAAAVLLIAGLLPRWRWTAGLTAAGAAAAGVGLAAVASERIRAIEVDRSAEVAAAEAAGAEKARERLRSRAAGVRFAEDTAADQADLAGVSVAEERGAYERAVEEQLAKIPAYRSRGKRSRGGQGSAAGAGEPAVRAGEEGESGEAMAEAGPEPTVRSLPESQLRVADRFDRGNRAAAWGLLSLATGLCGLEYVRRFNTAANAVCPLPLAGTVVDGLASKEHLAVLPAARLAGFLDQAVRKGESFIAFTESDPLPGRAELMRIGLGPLRWRLPKRTVSAGSLATDPGLLEIVFETAWFGRGCFVVTGDEAAAVLEQVAEACRRRSRTRAATRRTLDLVWALPEDPPPAAAADVTRLAGRLNLRWIRVS